MSDVTELLIPNDIFTYYSKTGSVISIDLIISSVLDIAAGYHISYSATELLKSLGFLTEKRNLTKGARVMVAREMHSRYHAGKGEYVLVRGVNETK